MSCRLFVILALNVCGLFIGVGIPAAQAAASPVQSVSATPAVYIQLAQSTDDDGNSGSTRVNTRGLFKLIGLVVVAVIGIGGWLFRRIRGE